MPRCAVSAHGEHANDAFRALPAPDREHVIRVLSSRDAPAFVDRAGYRFAAVRLEPLSCILLAGVPLEPARDERIRHLPSILNFSRGLLPNAANLHRLVESLLAADASLFEYCSLFGSKSGNAFVPLHVEPPCIPNSALRGWPLEFAVSRRRASLIAQSGTGREALAIPFIVSSLEQYVIVAQLRREISAADRCFLQAVSCVVDRVPDARSSFAQDGNLPAPMPKLRVAYVGTGPIDSRCASLFAAWEWPVTRTSYPSLANPDVRNTDLAIVDGAARGQPAPVLRLLRLALPRAMVVYLGAPVEEVTALADEVLIPEASALTAGRTFKRLARELREARFRDCDAAMAREAAVWRSLNSAAELTRRLAAILTDTVADWACVHVIDDDGKPYVAESPGETAPVLPDIPDFFLAEYPLFKPQLDEKFYAAISNDADAQERLAGLGATSGCAVPITADGALIGCVIALSLREVYDSEHFERISRAASAAGNAYVEMRTARRRTLLPDIGRVVCSAYQADAYSGPRSGAQASVSVAASAITIQLSGPGDLRLNGRLETHNGILYYDGTLIAEPLVINSCGMLPVLPVGGSERRVALARGSIVLLYPLALSGAVREQDVAALLRRSVRDEQWSVKDLLVNTLGANAVFAVISAAAV